jgi:hypothetical protein
MNTDECGFAINPVHVEFPSADLKQNFLRKRAMVTKENIFVLRFLLFKPVFISFYPWLI